MVVALMILVAVSVALFAGYFFRPAFDKWVEKVNRKAS